MQRRSFLAGIVASLAAPAIVRAGILMPCSGDKYKIWESRCVILPPMDRFVEMKADYLGPNGRFFEGTWTYFGKNNNMYSDKVIAFAKRELVY